MPSDQEGRHPGYCDALLRAADLTDEQIAAWPIYEQIFEKDDKIEQHTNGPYPHCVSPRDLSKEKGRYLASKITSDLNLSTDPSLNQVFPILYQEIEKDERARPLVEKGQKEKAAADLALLTDELGTFAPHDVQQVVSKFSILLLQEIPEMGTELDRMIGQNIYSQIATRLHAGQLYQGDQLDQVLARVVDLIASNVFPLTSIREHIGKTDVPEEDQTDLLASIRSLDDKSWERTFTLTDLERTAQVSARLTEKNIANPRAIPKETRQLAAQYQYTDFFRLNDRLKEDLELSAYKQGYDHPGKRIPGNFVAYLQTTAREIEDQLPRARRKSEQRICS